MSEDATNAGDGAEAPEPEVADAQVTDQTTDQVTDDAEVDGETVDETAQPEEDLEEVEWEGRKAKVPPEIKAALMRTADYTRKTQEVAEAKRAVEAQQQDFTRQAEAQQAMLSEYTKVGVMGDQIARMDAELGQYQQVDWAALEQADLINGTHEYQRYERAWSRLQRERDQAFAAKTAAETELGQKVKQRASDADSEMKTRIREGYAKLPEVIPGWNPELEVKVANFARSQGVTQDELQQAAANPRDIALLNLARIGFESLNQKKAAKQVQAAQQTTPARTVGAGAPSARRTTDASGDGLSTKEWIARVKVRTAQALKRA